MPVIETIKTHTKEEGLTQAMRRAVDLARSDTTLFITSDIQQGDALRALRAECRRLKITPHRIRLKVVSSPNRKLELDLDVIQRHWFNVVIHTKHKEACPLLTSLIASARRVVAHTFEADEVCHDIMTERLEAELGDIDA